MFIKFGVHEIYMFIASYCNVRCKYASRVVMRYANMLQLANDESVM